MAWSLKGGVALTDPENQWITAIAADPEPQPVTEVEEDLEPTGPTEPDPDIPAPDIIDQLPTRPMPSRTAGDVWYLSAHHGAGATTLARIDGGHCDAGHSWPVNTEGQNVVVVARETVAGLDAACRAATQWASGIVPTVRVLALVTIPARPGKPSTQVQRALDVAAGVYPIHRRTEWHPEYMDHTDPTHAPESKRTKATITTMHKLSAKKG